MRSVGNATLVSTVKNPAAVRCWQPANTPDGCTLLFNGHIDNRGDLKSELSLRDCGDPELYAAAYTRWGDTVDQRVIGQYCCAIIEPRGQEVRLVRSPLYAPPLHIWRNDYELIAASTPRAIFATGLVEQALDEQKIADSLLLNYEEEERSWFNNISRVPIGASAQVNRHGMQITRYYDPLALPKVRLSRDEDYVEAANSLLEDATKAALQDFSRPAISMSGGIDSQAVASMALKLLPESTRLKGYTGVPEAGWHDPPASRRFGNEWPKVQAFAEMYPQFDPEPVDAEALWFDHKLQEMFLLAGSSPRNTSNLHWIHEIWSRARKDRRDVILTGDYGNFTFSADGAWAFSEWFRQGKWATLIRELRMITPRGRSLLREFFSRVISPSLPDNIWQVIEKRLGRDPGKHFSSTFPINPDWAREMKVTTRAASLGFDFNYRRPVSAFDHRRNIGGGETGDIDQAFEQLYGIERRDPTSYRPLAEFCFSIPSDQYLRNGQTRWLARRMLKGRVPETVRTEKRRGTQAADWALRLKRERDNLISELDRLMKDPELCSRIDLAGLRRDLASWDGTEPAGGEELYNRLALALPRAATTARFIRYVEGRNDS